MKGIFFNKDPHFESLDLDNKIKGFLTSFKKIFKEQIIHEVFIIKMVENSKIVPIYFHCAHPNCEQIENISEEKARQIEKNKLKDFDFFIKNVISRQCILNDECIIAHDQVAGLFDAMFRMDDYYIGLNNVEYTFRDLQQKMGVSDDAFIRIVKNFYNELKK